jgi:hypothetical protein
MAEKTKPKVAAAMLAELWPSEIQKIVNFNKQLIFHHYFRSGLFESI